MTEQRRITINIDGTQIVPMQWPHSMVASIFPQPSLDSSCAIASCTRQADPLNVVEAVLDVFGSPVVRVCLCDDHFRLFGETTDEHEKPDIVTEDTLAKGGVIVPSQMAIVGEYPPSDEMIFVMGEQP